MTDPSSAGVPSSRAEAAASQGRLTAAAKGAILMIVASLFFSTMVGGIREVSSSIPAIETVFFRNLFGLMALSPLFFRHGLGILRANRYGLLLVRGCMALVFQVTWFYAVSVVPVADAVALSFTAPLFTTVLAIIVLKEVVRLRRWTATLVGFAGAILILRPGFAELDPNLLIVILSAAGMAAAFIVIKILSRTESSTTIVAYLNLFMVPAALIPSLFVWQWPTAEELMWLIMVGVSGTCAHLAMTKAFAIAETTVIMPFDFTRLPFTALIGYIAFSEVPDIWTWVGAAIIFSSTFYIARREAQIEREARDRSGG
tara:strand:- start:407 stop:1351 length:945 start_codon:yes stop_codon:yes gene_type:complete